MGNVIADETGFAKFEFYSNELTLVGPYSIIGRGVNVHAMVDDYGLTDAYFSQNCGNAGGRIACCGIVHSPQVYIIPPGLLDN
jgi:Cu-Zn family superoxide dismutase